MNRKRAAGNLIKCHAAGMCENLRTVTDIERIEPGVRVNSSISLQAKDAISFPLLARIGTFSI